jgi:hypothetical protein
LFAHNTAVVIENVGDKFSRVINAETTSGYIVTRKFAPFLLSKEELIFLVPQRDDCDEEFPTTVTTWDEVRHFGKAESINFIPVAIGDLFRAKTRGEW